MMIGYTYLMKDTIIVNKINRFKCWKGLQKFATAYIIANLF